MYTNAADVYRLWCTAPKNSHGSFETAGVEDLQCGIAYLRYVAHGRWEMVVMIVAGQKRRSFDVRCACQDEYPTSDEAISLHHSLPFVICRQRNNASEIGRREGREIVIGQKRLR